MAASKKLQAQSKISMGKVGERKSEGCKVAVITCVETSYRQSRLC